MTPIEIRDLFDQSMQGADIGLIEGNKGLFDGLALDGSNSNAALASMLEAPIVLVLDSQGMTRGVAPLILGYQAFDPSLRILGVILNKVGGSRHESKLRKVIEHYTDVRVLGAVQRDDALRIDERHLGLVPSNEASGSPGHIAKMASMLLQQVDLKALGELAAEAPSVSQRVSIAKEHPVPDVTLAYAADSAFGFYYADDLDALRAAGARLVPFSPVRDRELPSCDGLFLGGGFPETHMNALEENTALRKEIAGFIAQGGPVYAECGGLMYLCDNLTWRGNTRKLCGVIAAAVEMHDKPQGRGYVQLRETSDHPWPTRGNPTKVIPAHEFHYSALATIPEGMRFGYSVERGFGLDGKYDGIVYRNLLASYAHLRNTTGHPWAARFTAFVRQCRADNRGGQ
jgi:cobyrinic acid a,c-diamide synthase